MSKELRAKKKTLEKELSSNKETIAEEQRKGQKLLKELREIEDELEMLERKKGKVAVTDHAVVRYLERVAGVDIDAVKREIQELVPSRKGLEGIDTLNVFKGPIKLVVKDNIVVTVAPK